jgi:hypothetical protein
MQDSQDPSPSILAPILVGIGLQLLMVFAGHYSAGVTQLFAGGGMAISGLAGLLASIRGRERRRPAAAGRGAVVGGACAFVGILASDLLGDAPATLLGLGTVTSAVTGAIGGLIGRMLSVLRRE